MSALAFQQYQAQFTGRIRDPRKTVRPQGVEARRMKVYEDIVRHNLHETLSACFPVAKKVLGVRRWEKLVRAFLAEHRCSTPLFRQIPEEFLHYFETAKTDDLPSFLFDLVHYEWVELALNLSDAELQVGVEPDGDLLKGIPVLAPAHMLLAYRYAVQRISPRFKPKQADRESTHILAFRRPDDEIKFIVLNPVSAYLVELIQQGMSGSAALEAVAARLHHLKKEVVVQGGYEILENLRTEQAIWGTRGK